MNCDKLRKKCLFLILASIVLSHYLTKTTMDNKWQMNAVAHGKAYWDKNNKFRWIEKDCVDWFDVRK